jgi:hypothetical protein
MNITKYLSSLPLPSWVRGLTGTDTQHVACETPAPPTLHRVSKNIGVDGQPSNVAYSKAFLKKLAGAQRPAPAPVKLAERERPLIVPQGDQVLEATCPQESCGHVFRFDRSKHQDGNNLALCPSCKTGGYLKDFKLHVVKATASAPARTAPATARPAPREDSTAASALSLAASALSCATTALASAAKGKKYHQINANGECVELSAEMASFVGRGASLGNEWRETFGLPRTSEAMRFSQAMAKAAANDIERFQARSSHSVIARK